MAVILVVDDNAASRELTAAALEPTGHRVEEAGSAEEALDALVGSRPDLILTDLSLPGMSGLELTRRLKSSPESRAIPIVAVTAHAMPGDEDVVRAAGCDGYIPKPIRIRALVTEVERLLNRRGPAR